MVDCVPRYPGALNPHSSAVEIESIPGLHRWRSYALRARIFARCCLTVCGVSRLPGLKIAMYKS